jgi:hypothetical protein
VRQTTIGKQKLDAYEEWFSWMAEGFRRTEHELYFGQDRDVYKLKSVVWGSDELESEPQMLADFAAHITYSPTK